MPHIESNPRGVLPALFAGFTFFLILGVGVGAAQFAAFNLTVSPTTVFVAGGAVAKFTVTLTPTGGFTGVVTLEVSGLLPAMRSSWSQNPVQVSAGKPSSTTLNIAVGSNIPFGSTPLQIAATSGTITKQASASLVVTKVLIDRSHTSALRVDVESVQHVSFRASWAHDGTPVVGGALSFNASTYKTNSSGWVTFPVTSTIVRRLSFVPFAVDASGVQSFQMLAPVPSIIWDRIRVDEFVVDRRVDIGVRQPVAARVIYEYDRQPLTADDGQVFINGQLANYDVALGAWYVEAQLSTVGSQQFSVTRTVESTVGLKQVYDIISPVTIVWDTVNIVLQSEKEYVDVGTAAPISFTGRYAYDQTEFVGTVTLSDTAVKQTAGKVLYTVVSIDDAAYGLTHFSSNVVAVTFDRLLIIDAGGPARAQVARTETVWFKIVYESDNMVFDSLHGSVFANGTSLSWSGQSQRWELRISSNEVAKHTYNVTDVDDRSRNLAAYYDAAGPQDVIWDRLRVVSTYISKTTQKTSSYISINLYLFNWTLQRVFPVLVTAYVVYAYDGAPLMHGQVFINDSRSLHENRTHLWVATFASRNEGNFTFRVSSVIDTQYGITAFEDVTRPVTVQFIAVPSATPYLLILSSLLTTAIFRIRKTRQTHSQSH